MRTPLISIIIPTRQRPYLLPRAVKSAIDHAAMTPELEIIVVPNGGDQSWQTSLAAFKGDRRVKVHPIETPHANAARNVGLHIATGKYVRFLDDDDYLLPASAAQLQYLESTNADFCSGLVVNIDSDGKCLGQLPFPLETDLTSAILGFSSLNLPVGNVFLREICNNVRWNERADRMQDLIWMLSLTIAGEWNWVHFPEQCGVWFQHSGPRTSSTKLETEKSACLILSLRDLYEELSKQGRLTETRAAAISSLSWEFAHAGFPFHPIHWDSVARFARHVCPYSRPAHGLFSNPLLANISPLFLEWLMLPVRAVTSRYRSVKADLNGRDYRRAL